MSIDTTIDTNAPATDVFAELASVARLVTYARSTTKELHAEFPTYCLDLALGAILEEISNRGIENVVFDEENGTFVMPLAN